MAIYWTAPLTNGCRRTPARGEPQAPPVTFPACGRCQELVIEGRCGCQTHRARPGLTWQWRFEPVPGEGDR